jgi:hypothetical protein
MITPFILERAKPSKDGDAKLWALSSTFLCLGVVARPPKGWAEAMSPSVPESH